MLFGNVPGIDLPVSRLVQGTNLMTLENLQFGLPLLDDVFDLGCNAFDTARSYQGGESQQALGRWLASRGVREQVVIIGKGGHPRDGVKRVTPSDITADLEDSLRDLGTDHVDLFLLHRDDPEVPVGPLVEVLNERLRRGEIRAFGGSNWSHRRIQEANHYAAERGLTPFTASSPQFSLAVQHRNPYPENPGSVTLTGADQQEARDWYRQTGMPVFAWSSLAGGFLTGKFARMNLDEFTDPFDRRVVSAYCLEDNFARLDRARQLAEAKAVSLPEIGVAYVLGQPMNVFALVGSRSRTEFAALRSGSQLRLTAEESAWLEEGRGSLP